MEERLVIIARGVGFCVRVFPSSLWLELQHVAVVLILLNNYVISFFVLQAIEVSFDSFVEFDQFIVHLIQVIPQNIKNERIGFFCLGFSENINFSSAVIIYA